jgi:hypothetical protein
MKKLLLAGIATMGMLASPASAAWVYLGSWYVGDGPLWTSNPTVMSGLDVAAMKWPGYSAYAISTVDSNPANINFSAFLDGWGDTTYFTTPAPQGYKLSSRSDGGYDLSPAFSAWVLDHSCYYRYSDPSLSCEPGEPGLNFAFGTMVPEPATWGMLIAGFGLVGTMARRRRPQALIS